MRRSLFLLLLAGFLTSCSGYPEASPWSQIQDDDCVFFIQDPSGTRELWFWCEGQESKPFLEGIGGIQDFTLAGNDLTVYFIRSNDIEGADLWVSNNLERSPIRLVDCKSLQCSEIAYNSALNVLAFSDFESKPELKLYDLENGQMNEYDYHAAYLEFSPDGKHLSFFDRISGQLVILNISGVEILRIDSQEGLTGGWSSDSQQILFGAMTFQDEIPGVNVFSLNIQNGQSEIIHDGDSSLMEIYQPQFLQSPNQLIASVRIPRFGFNRQLWLFNEAGDLVTRITDDYTFDHSAFRVNHNQSRVVFQRFSPGAPNSQPEVWMADLDGNNLLLLARNATNPQWVSIN